MKICLSCSAGGHLAEMLQLQPLYKKFDHFFITFEREDSKSLKEKEKVFFVERPGRNPIKTIYSAVQSLKILLKEKPGLIIATGADVTVPVCFLGKLLGKKIIFIESFCRPLRPGVSGRLVYRIADLFIYQWKGLAKYYPKGKYGGFIF